MGDQSCFLHLVLVNCNGESMDSWVMVPDRYAAIGYLKFIFLPMAYFTWLARDEVNGLVIPDDSMDGDLEMFANSEKCKYKADIPIMREQLNALNKIWHVNINSILPELKAFSTDIHTSWNQSMEVFFYFDIFGSSQEVSDYIIKSYEEDDMIDRFEEQIGISQFEWNELVSQVNESEFMRRRFIGILNNQIEDML